MEWIEEEESDFDGFEDVRDKGRYLCYFIACCNVYLEFGTEEAFTVCRSINQKKPKVLHSMFLSFCLFFSSSIGWKLYYFSLSLLISLSL